jgi:hypothetical protein
MREISFWKISGLNVLGEEPKRPSPRKEVGSAVLIIWRSSSSLTALFPLKLILPTEGASGLPSCAAVAFSPRQNRKRRKTANRREALTPDRWIFCKKKTYGVVLCLS